MSDSTPTPSLASARYRLLWRWHFYAGLFVMPFLIVLAITGTLYCFQPQIEPLLYPHRLIVEDRAQPRLSYTLLLAQARRAVPAGSAPVTVSVDTARTRSAEFIFKLPSGDMSSVYVNPYDGQPLGTLSVDDRFIQQMRMLHRKLLVGKPGELLMEMVACWTLVMIATGVALWWPRRLDPRGAVLAPRRSAKGRVWWKELHSAVGIWLAVGAVAFVLSGLPWTGFWGKGFQKISTLASMGSPDGAWGDPTVQSATATAKKRVQENAMPGMVMEDLPLKQTPWAVALTTVPDTADARVTPTRSIDDIVRIVAQRGVETGYQLVLPKSVNGVFTVSYFPADPKAERTIHIDRYSGAVLKDIRYQDYGTAAQVVAYGTALHMGRYFGLANQLLCAAISMGLVVLAVTGFWMWWRRRPRATLSAPKHPSRMPPMRAWVIGLTALGMLLPLLGVTLIIVWMIDRWIVVRLPSRALS